jgi:hypothetical protein
MVDPATNMLVDKASLPSSANGFVAHSRAFPFIGSNGGSGCSPHNHQSLITGLLSHGFTVTGHQSLVPSHQSSDSGPGNGAGRRRGPQMHADFAHLDDKKLAAAKKEFL